MLVVRDEQMMVLGRYMLVRYEKKVLNFLQTNFADAKQKSVEQLKPFVREQVEKARSYELLTERQIAVYVTTAWLLCGEFDVKFWQVSDQLNSAELSAHEKVRWLAQWEKDKSNYLKGKKYA